jgi:hypothetical protein
MPGQRGSVRALFRHVHYLGARPRHRYAASAGEFSVSLAVASPAAAVMFLPSFKLIGRLARGRCRLKDFRYA